MSRRNDATVESEPVVYPLALGAPHQFEVLLGSVTALVDREPPETFANSGVCAAAGRLAGLLNTRAAEGRRQ